MRLIRFGAVGQEKPGLLCGEKIVDLRSIFPQIPDIGEAFFRDGWLRRVKAVENEGKKIKVRLGCPIYRPSKIICLGLNYIDHKEESGFEKPERPLLFCKTPGPLTRLSCPAVAIRSIGRLSWRLLWDRKASA